MEKLDAGFGLESVRNFVLTPVARLLPLFGALMLTACTKIEGERDFIHQYGQAPFEATAAERIANKKLCEEVESVTGFNPEVNIRLMASGDAIRSALSEKGGFKPGVACGLTVTCSEADIFSRTVTYAVDLNSERCRMLQQSGEANSD